MKKTKQLLSLILVFALIFSSSACIKNGRTENLPVSTAQETSEFPVTVTEDNTEEITYETIPAISTVTADKTITESAVSKNNDKKSVQTILSETISTTQKRTTVKTKRETTRTKKLSPLTTRRQTTETTKVTATVSTTKSETTNTMSSGQSISSVKSKKGGTGITSAAAKSITEPSNTQTESAAPTVKTETVKVRVNCRHAAEYGASGVPSGGVIIETEVPYSSGDTAMDSLKKALTANNIEIDESRGYVKAIAGLREKDCGGSSGWMYMVNNEIPMTSADKYSVSPDDTVIFYYVTNYGDRF